MLTPPFITGQMPEQLDILTEKFRKIQPFFR